MQQKIIIMKVSITYEVDKRMKSDNTFAVRFVLTCNRKRKFYGSSIVLKKNEVTAKGKIKNSQALSKLDRMLQSYREKLYDMDIELHEYSIDYVYKRVFLVKKAIELDFAKWAMNYCECNKNRPVVRTTYTTALKSFIRFMGTPINVTDMTSKTMKAYEDSLTGADSKHKYTGSIKYLFKVMRNEYNDYDVDDVQIKDTMASYTPPRRPIAEKRALTVGQIRAIMQAPAVTGDKVRDMARDSFILSFALLGMNSVDLYECDACKNGRTIVYNRRKVTTRRADKATMEVDVPEEVMPVYLRNKGKKNVFRFAEMYSGERNYNKHLNEGLKVLAAEINGINYTALRKQATSTKQKLSELLDKAYESIPEPVLPRRLQFYAARHSMATIAVNDCGISKYVVNDMLNHVDSSLIITELYIKKDFRQVNDANRKLLSFVCKDITVR